MTTTFVLIASGILIGAGISVIWRDLQRNRRKAFVLQRDLSTGDDFADAEVEITIAHRQTVAPAAYAGLASLGSLAARRPRAPSTPLAALQEAVARYDQGPHAWPDSGPDSGPDSAPDSGLGSGPEPWPQDARQPTVEMQWSHLQPTIAAGVAQVNTVLAPARLRLGAPGEAAWSYKHKGFGAYRRLLLGEESLAWVRVELSAGGVLGVNIKAHKEECAALNGTAGAPAEGLTPAAVSDLLSACLKPAATHAVQLSSDGDAGTPAGNGAWQDVDAIVSAALRATNGALAQTGARLLPLAPAAWDAEMRRHRMTLAVEVDAADVARMQIERLPHEMEVAVGVRDARMIDLGRRRRIPIEGMTTHALAELIASCAWPAIARSKEARRPA